MKTNVLSVALSLAIVGNGPVMAHGVVGGVVSGTVSAAGETAELGAHAALDAIVLSAKIVTGAGARVIEGGEQAARVVDIAVENSYKLGREIVIVAAKETGNVVRITYRATVAASEVAAGLAAAGIQLASGASLAAIEFTVAVSKDALDAASNGVRAILDGLAAGSHIAVRVVAITAGAASKVIGFSLVLATSPAVVITALRHLLEGVDWCTSWDKPGCDPRSGNRGSDTQAP